MKRIIRITGVPLLLMLSLVGCSSNSNVKEDQMRKDLIGREVEVHSNQAIGVSDWKLSDNVKIKLKSTQVDNDNKIEYDIVDMEDSKTDIDPASGRSDLYSHKISSELKLQYRYYNNSWRLQNVIYDQNIMDDIKKTGDYIKIPELKLTVDKVKQDLESSNVTMLNEDESKYITFGTGDIKNLEITDSKYNKEYGTYTLNVKIKFSKSPDDSQGGKSNSGEGLAMVRYYYDFLHKKWLSPKIVPDKSLNWEIK